MRSIQILNRGLGIFLALFASAAFGHASGFHKKIALQITKTTITGLLVMDVDSREACVGLRAAADEDRNGVIEKEEVTKLKNRLIKMATRNLKLDFSGAKVAVEIKESKLSLRDDFRPNDSGLSLAIYLEMRHPYQLSEGTKFQFTDISPDTSPIALKVEQASSEAAVETEVESGKIFSVRLGKLEGP
jgi:hypothetical protein